MFKMSVQMEMTVGQLDWLSRPFIKKDYPEYHVKFKLKIPESSYYSETIWHGHIPEAHRLTKPDEEYRIVQFESNGFEGQIEGLELRKYLLDLKKNIETAISEIGLDKDRFFIVVDFKAEELPDLRVY
ncbi:hypothetical protein [Bacillus marasmi]|uniref:hypothetical protein n=1 Tax=Bacillus marasmi TaxID=1926279 RepID=UPI0011CC5133|nr:hypothetical protein [Bacillus marasmi]